MQGYHLVDEAVQQFAIKICCAYVYALISLSFGRTTGSLDNVKVQSLCFGAI